MSGTPGEKEKEEEKEVEEEEEEQEEGGGGAGGGGGADLDWISPLCQWKTGSVQDEQRGEKHWGGLSSVLD